RRRRRDSCPCALSRQPDKTIIAPHDALFSLPNAVVDQEQAERDRQKIEERVVTRQADDDLQRDEKRTADQPDSSRHPDEEWRDQLREERERRRRLLHH